MKLTAAVTARLENAGDLAGIVSAAYQAFEVMVPLIEDQQDPAGGAFTAFVMAAAYAANGRDALLFAPSLQPASAGRAGAGYPPAALEAATALNRLSSLIADRLTVAAGLAADEADRRACAEGRRQASRLAALLAGVTGQ